MNRRAPIATRQMPAAYGGFIRVPAYVMAEPRRRGHLTNWLKHQRAIAAQPSGEVK